MATLTFWGGVGTVTGSKFLLEHEGRRVLVDCGLFQGLKNLRELNWQDPPFDARSIDAVVLTHAHIDHTGYLPRLVKQGFRGAVITSKATCELLKILLPDAARLQSEEADYRNRHHLTRHNPALPLYDERDAEAALNLLRGVSNDDSRIEITENFRASFRSASHILGASSVLIEIDGAGEDNAGRRILFSGDLGYAEQVILPDPARPPACDYLVVESTYGDRLHDEENPSEKLAEIIREAAAKNSPILIPSFAVGRTQELLYLIRELEDAGQIPTLPVTVDSPMAHRATAAYQRFAAEFDREYAGILAQNRHPLRTRSITTAATREDSTRLNHKRGARIIISASGMMTGGRVLHHARRMLPDENAIVIFVGFQAAGTTGRKILEGAAQVKIMKEFVPVRCRVERIEGFSAHADWQDVLRWLETMSAAPKQAFITHGEPEAAAAMAELLREKFGWTVKIPAYGEKFDLV